MCLDSDDGCSSSGLEEPTVETAAGRMTDTWVV